MFKIVTNVNKKDVVSTWTLGQAFPALEGKIVSVEANGKELLEINECTPVPIAAIDTSFVSWHGRNAGRLLRSLRELLST